MKLRTGFSLKKITKTSLTKFSKQAQPKLYLICNFVIDFFVIFEIKNHSEITSKEIIKPLDQRIKEAQSLRMIEVLKSVASRNELPNHLKNPKSLARRAKQSKKKYEETYGKPSEKAEEVLGGISTNQSISKNTEINKSSTSNKNLSDDDNEAKKDEALQFSFRDYVKGPRDIRKATCFINYLNSCEGEKRVGLVTSKWFLPLVTKAIRDLIDPSQL